MQFTYYKIHLLPAHPVLQIGDMTWGGVYASADLDRADRFHTEPLGEVDHIGMVADQFHATQRRGLPFPTGDGLVEFGEVDSKVCLKGRGILRVVVRKPVRDG